MDRIYEELYEIDQTKGFENPEFWSASNFNDYILDGFRNRFIREIHNIDWDEIREMSDWLLSMKYGPPKPPLTPVHKPIANTFRFADVISQHTVYDDNYNIVRYMDGNGNWVEVIPTSTEYATA